MDRDQIIAKLREYAPELKTAGVQHLFLHGSYARGTAIRGSSDVDIIAEFEPGRRLSLVDMVAIENRLTELLGVRAIHKGHGLRCIPERSKNDRRCRTQTAGDQRSCGPPRCGGGGVMPRLAVASHSRDRELATTSI